MRQTDFFIRRVLLSAMVLMAVVMRSAAQDFNAKSTPLTFEAIEPTTICFDNKAAGPVTYRVNDGEVQTIQSGQEEYIDLENPGDKVSLYGDNESYYNKGKYSTIYVDEYGTYEGHFYVYGNIMSLVNSTGFATATALTADYAFARLFYYNGWKNPEMESHPTKDLVLPATTLTAHCYEYMFYGCTGLTRAPVLPATTLTAYCYEYMFYGCTGLTRAPVLPATTLAERCYEDMFRECKNLQTAPALPATKMVSHCYSGMFLDCTSLTTAPELPATSLAYGCYRSMFNGCANLSAAPVLNATTLAQDCYSYMFSGCTSLETAPDLPATIMESECYDGMFSGCTNLTAAPTLSATIMKKGCYSNIFSGCSRLTTAPDLPATTLAEDCYAGMFKGCTGITSAPALPAIRLEEHCYAYMFQDCTGLTSAPDLLAPILEEDCYEYMFDGCSALNSMKCLACNITAYNCTFHWLDNVSETGTFTMGPGVRWKSGADGIPTGWNVVETNELTVIPKGFYKANLKAFEYWTTFYNSVTNFEADENTSVYTAYFNGQTLKLKEVEDHIIRAGQGVILISKNAIITLTSTTKTGTESYYDGNELLGSDTEVSQDGTSSYYIFDMHDYVLDEEEEEELEFEKVYGDVPAQVAYLKVSSGYSDRWMSIEDNGEDYLDGDVNGDGMVTITDVLMILDKILGNPSENFNEEAADLNHDSMITYADAMMVMDIILNNSEE